MPIHRKRTHTAASTTASFNGLNTEMLFIERTQAQGTGVVAPWHRGTLRTKTLERKWLLALRNCHIGRPPDKREKKSKFKIIYFSFVQLKTSGVCVAAGCHRRPSTDDALQMHNLCVSRIRRKRSVFVLLPPHNDDDDDNDNANRDGDGDGGGIRYGTSRGETSNFFAFRIFAFRTRP